MAPTPFRLIVFLLSASVVILIVCFFLYKPGSEKEGPGCGVIDDPNRIAIENEIRRLDSVDLAQDPKLKSGHELFKDAGCVACHSPFRKLVGPPLAKISERRNKDWIFQAILNFNVLIKKEDTTALKLYKEYGEIVMPPNDFLTTNQIDDIIYYLDHVKERIR